MGCGNDAVYVETRRLVDLSIRVRICWDKEGDRKENPWIMTTLSDSFAGGEWNVKTAGEMFAYFYGM